jgi:DNA-binding NtrC family response regulator
MNDILYLGSDYLFAEVAEAAQAAFLTAAKAESAAELIAAIPAGGGAVVVADLAAPDFHPIEFLDAVRDRSAAAMTILLLEESATASDAARLVRLGAYHCLDANAPVDEFSRVVEQAYEESRQRAALPAAATADWRSLLVGESPCMNDIARVVELIAPRRCTVLIVGETGTGKEVAAKAIHMASGRGHLPMISLNCSAIPEHLLEAELFGHTKGAFTGAVAPRAGRFEQANNSTLFLDEIGDMSIDLQAKLLRVLQERELQRLGSSETIKVNVRVIAASNLDILERVRQGKFREDLYYRLNVVQLRMPALRERASDIRLLARHFVSKICRLEGIPAKQVFNEALEHLTWYSWPGNVRQLENVVEKAVVLSGVRANLVAADFQVPGESGRRIDAAVLPPARLSVPDEGLDFVQVVTSFEKDIVEQALRKTNGNKTLAADLLRLKRTTLISKIRGYEAMMKPGPNVVALNSVVFTPRPVTPRAIAR